MGGTHNHHARIFQTLGITPLLTVGKGIADIGEILVTVAAHHLVIGLTVEPETVLAAKLCRADAHADDAAIGDGTTVAHLYLHMI